MSFILDALRKAENKNRSRHEMTVPKGPIILDDETPSQPTDWRKLIVIGAAAVALMAIGLLVGLYRNDAPSAPIVISEKSANDINQASASSTPSQRAPINNEPAAAAQSRSSQPRSTGARALDQEVRKGQPRRAPTTASTETQSERVAARSVSQPSPTSSGNNQQTPKTNPGTVTVMPSRASSGRVDNEVLPEYGAIVASGKVALPLLHLDMHVYSAQPQKRFVFINLDKYKEGATLDGGTSVESIRTDGVVLNHKGFRFVLRAD